MGASSPTHIHFLCQAKPFEERKNTQAQIITEMRRRLAAHPSYRPSITSRNALGSGEGAGGFAIAANILGPDLAQIVDYSKRALAAAADIPSITEYKLSLDQELSRRGIEFPVGTRIRATGPVLFSFDEYTIIVMRVGQIEAL